MENINHLIKLREQVKEANLMLAKGLTALVGTSFTCEKYKVARWNKSTELVEWTISEYDFEEEYYVVECSENEYYYIHELTLLRILDEMEGRLQ